MADATQLRRISVIREPKRAEPIALRLIDFAPGFRTGIFSGSRAASPPMLSQVLMRTAGFFARFDRLGNRHLAVIPPQPFELRRRARRGERQTGQSHRFRWPASANMPASLTSSRASPELDLTALFDPFDLFDSAREDTAEWTPPLLWPAGEIMGDSHDLQSSTAAVGSPPRPIPFRQPGIDFSERAMPYTSRMRSGHASASDLQWTLERGFDPSLRSSPFLVARAMSGEAALASETSFAPPVMAPAIAGRMFFGLTTLPESGAARSNRGLDSPIGQVYRRASWQPPGSVESRRAQKTIGQSIGERSPSSTAISLTRGQMLIEPPVPLPLSASAAVPGFVPPPVPPMLAASPQETRTQAGVALPAETPMPLASRESILLSPRSAEQIGPFGGRSSTARSATTRSAVSPPAVPAAERFPTVLRSAMVGAESGGWTETGPVSPVLGELGRLVTPIAPVPSAPEQLHRATARVGSARGVFSAAELPFRLGVTFPASAGFASMATLRSNMSSPLYGASTRRTPSTASKKPSALPVFRSALADRSEPDAEQQSSAHALMAMSVGAPLPPLVRRSMEQRFGADLGAVRVHSGPSIARATNLLAAKAMTRGTDVFMQADVPDRIESDSMPLLAHELTHVASHLGRPQREQRSPLVLAQRSSSEESRAEDVERTVSTELQSRPAAASPRSSPPMPLTVSRSESPVVVQREVAVNDAVVPATESAPTGPTATEPQDAGQLAEKVYALLERRLLVERERGGFRRN